MQELLARFAEFEDDDEPFAVISDVTWLDRSVKMGVMIGAKHPYSSERWEVHCDQLRSHNIRTEFGSPLLLTEDHATLWEYQHDTAQAFFYGTPQNADACVGALYTAHVRSVGSWIEFIRFFNSTSSLRDMLKTGGGLLARGPIPILEVYKEALRDLGVDVDIRFPRPNKIPGVQALIIGKSYFVGNGWNAARLSES